MSVVKHCGNEGTTSLPGRNMSVVKHGKEGTTSLLCGNMSVVVNEMHLQVFYKHMHCMHLESNL